MKKRRNKLFYGVLCSGFILTSAITVFAANNSASLALQVHETKVESAAVGLATKANAEVWNSTKSSGSVTVKIYAAWDGWPYTCEQTNKLSAGAHSTFVENQSQSSSFKLRFESGGGVATVGKITI